MNERRRITGIVTSNKMMKTVVVEISRTYRHPVYKKSGPFEQTCQSP